MRKDNKGIKEMQRFERWMLKRVKTVHYADTQRMSEAYEKVYKNATT